MSTIREYTKGVASFDHQSLASFIEPKKEKRDQLLRLDRYVNPVDHPQLHKTLTKKITVIKQEASLPGLAHQNYP